MVAPAFQVPNRKYKTLVEEPGGFEAYKNHVTSAWCAGISHIPKIDYCTLGLLYHPDYHEALKYTLSRTFKLGRWVYKKRKILFDGLQVGALNFSQGVSERFGRRINMDFRGQFFRAGFSCADAWWFRNEFEDWVYNHCAEVERQDWVSFTSIERIDWAVEVLKPELEVSSQTVRDCEEIHLPGRFRWTEFSGSAKGLTHYAAGQTKGIENRRKKPLFRCYGYHAPEGATHLEDAPHEARVLRFEAEHPALRKADGTLALDQAQRDTADLFEALTPYRYVAECDLPEKWAYAHEIAEEDALILPPYTYVIPTPNFGESVRPETYARWPYVGHFRHEVERQRDQGWSLVEKTIGIEISTELVASLDWRDKKLARLEEIYASLEAEYEGEPECLELAWERAFEDEEIARGEKIRLEQWREAERVKRDFARNKRIKAWRKMLDNFGPITIPHRGPSVDRSKGRWGKKEESTLPNIDRLSAPLSEPSAVFDPSAYDLRTPSDRFSKDELRGVRPMELERIRRYQTLLQTYSDFFYPDAEPWDQSISAALYYKWALRPGEMIKRYLEPVPIRDLHTTHWVKHKDADGLTFFVNEETGEELYPGDREALKIEREYAYKWHHKTAKRYRMDSEEEREKKDEERRAARFSHELQQAAKLKTKRENRKEKT